MSQAWDELLDAELAKADRVVILGVGNERKGDDAAGVLCAVLIRRMLTAVRPDVLIINGGEAPENETGQVRKFKPSHVLVIDAGFGGYTPGTIFVVDPQAVSVDDLSTHHLPLSLLLRYLEASLECRVICLAIEPRLIEMSRGLSDEVKRAVAALAERVVGLLERKPLL